MFLIECGVVAGIESAKTNDEVICVLHFKECEAHWSKFDYIFNVCYCIVNGEWEEH